MLKSKIHVMCDKFDGDTKVLHYIFSQELTRKQIKQVKYILFTELQLPKPYYLIHSK